jgi:hypothetical protein
MPGVVLAAVTVAEWLFVMPVRVFCVFFSEPPHPAAARPTAATSARARTALTSYVYATSMGHSRPLPLVELQVAVAPNGAEVPTSGALGH